MGKLYNKIKEYNDRDVYPFHMPGHKRNIKKIFMDDPFKLDISEVEGFDNLHNPKNLLLDIMENAAKIYKTKKTYFLINGSTCGILSAIAATTKGNGTILIARNCHKSVYNGILLGGLKALYVYPELIEEFHVNGSINASDVELALRHNPDIMALLITSPTYEGVVSDVKAIADICHKYNVPLIVDEAHGAHFGMNKAFPDTSINLGADIVIQSLHKTLTSLTQTALLHVNSDGIPLKKLEKFLGIYQSSSPSYVLLSSIDNCINYFNSKGDIIFPLYIELLIKYRKLINNLKNIKLMELNTGYNTYDISKIVLSVKGLSYTGMQFHNDLLHKYKIQVEMASADYIIVLTSCLDKEDGFERLYRALMEIDKNLEKDILTKESSYRKHKLETVYTIYQASEAATIKTSLEKALGKVSAEYMYLYPPGIPIIVPGERISQDIIDSCRYYERSGLNIEGLESQSLDEIQIIKEDNI